MPRKDVELTILPPDSTELKQIVPDVIFESLPFWGTLNTNQKAILKEEGQGLAMAQLAHLKSGLVIGEHLKRVRDALKPVNGGFTKFVRKFQFKSERSAYRYIQGYERITEMFPKTIIDVAAARGMRILGPNEDRPFGIYSDAVRQLPPPRNADIEQAQRYCDQLDETFRLIRKGSMKVRKPKRSTFKATPKNIRNWTEIVIRTFRAHFNRLPQDERKGFLHDIIGMQLTEAGVSGGHFNAIAIPEEFKTGRGRPRSLRDEEEKLLASA